MIEEMTAVRVTLSDQEMRFAAMAGLDRGLSGIQYNRQHKHNAKQNSVDNWGRNIYGAIAELAVARYLGLYWSGLSMNVGDVGPVDVRWTEYNNGHLILHDSDLSDRAFVLVTGWGPVFSLRGWAFAGTYKQKEYVKSLQPGRPAYCVPQDLLLPMDALMRDLS